eukprot:scaffold57328_cov22-Tisochrysis_lutea.AAC.2
MRRRGAHVKARTWSKTFWTQLQCPQPNIGMLQGFPDLIVAVRTHSEMHVVEVRRWLAPGKYRSCTTRSWQTIRLQRKPASSSPFCVADLFRFLIIANRAQSMEAL